MSIQYVPLGDVVELQAGIGFPLNLQGKTNGAYPFAKVGDISRCGRSGSSILPFADHYVDREDVERLRAKLVPEGSVLFAKIGEAIRQNHRVIAGCDLLIDNNAMAAIPSEKIEGRFLYHYLKTVDFYSLAPATTVPALRKSDLERLPVPLPPLSEQRRIASILDKADVIRSKRREALAKFDRLAQSIFNETFSSAIEACERIPLSTLVQEFRYGTSNKSGVSGFPALRIPNVASGSLNLTELKTVPVEAAELKRLRLYDGDVLFVRTNGNQDYVGRCAVFREENVKGVGFDTVPFIYASYLIRARLDMAVLLPEILQTYLASDEGRADLLAHSKTSAGQFNINTEGLGALKIPRFPMPLQVEYVKRLEVVERQRAQQKAHLIKLECLFESLQYSAFQGEL